MSDDNKKQVEFVADKLTIFGPKVDGGLTIKFDVGEYEQQQVAQLLMIPQQTAIKVRVEIDAS